MLARSKMALKQQDKSSAPLYQRGCVDLLVVGMGENLMKLIAYDRKDQDKDPVSL